MINRKEAPTYDLEKHMNSLYKNLLLDSTAAPTSTDDFIIKLKELKIEKEDISVSFDIENVYPSIEKEEILKIVNRKTEKEFGINKISEALISTSNLIVNEDHFVYDNTFCKPKNGFTNRITNIWHFWQK